MAKLKTTIGQIYFTHPRDENFTSLYQEAFSKHGRTYELFTVVEIERADLDRQQTKAEYEKLVQNMVSAFKRTYIAAPVVDEETFEKALAAINTGIGRLASRNKVSWYGKLNAAIGVISGNQFSLSVAGNGIVYLVRHGEFSLLSEGLAEAARRGAKIFTNFSTGSLRGGDRIILSTKQLFNYLSLDRIRDFLGEETLEESCQEIIQSLEDIKTVGFASFIVETYSSTRGKNVAPLESVAIAATPGLKKPPDSQVFSSAAKRYSILALRFLGHFLLGFLGMISRLFGNLLHRRSKKYLVAAIVVVLLILVANISIASFRKSSQQKKNQETTVLSEVKTKLDEVEAAMIYGDDRKIATLLSEAESLLSGTSSKFAPDERIRQEERLAALKNKLNKEEQIDNPTILTQFPNIPTDLTHSPNGFLAFNRDSGSMAFYDFRLGETKTVLTGANTGNLMMGAYVGGNHGFLFLDRQGRFERVDLENNRLIGGETATSTAVIDPATSEIAALTVLGEGTGARLYLVDTKQNQIWRVRVNEATLGNPERWLKGSADLSEARSVAVDGSIYVQFAKRVDKYFNGQQQSFELSSVVPNYENFTRAFTKADYQYLYILEPEKNRVLIYNKSNGKLEKQLTATKFKDAADLHVDEKARIIYLLAGNELLQVNF